MELLQQIQPRFTRLTPRRLLFLFRRQLFLQCTGYVANVRLGDLGLTRTTCLQLGVDGHHMFVRAVGESGAAVDDFPANFPVAIRTALMMDPMSTEDSLVGGLLWRLSRSYVLDSAGWELREIVQLLRQRHREISEAEERFASLSEESRQVQYERARGP